jgi:hypothetical protein
MFSLPSSLLEGRAGEGRRHIPLILNLSNHLNITGPAMERLPNLQQDPVTVSSPLAIPKTKLLNILRSEESLPLLIIFPFFRKTMVRAVQLQRQPRKRTIEIQDVFAKGMLAPEFESSKSPRPQNPPKFPFIPGLLPAEAARLGGYIHGMRVQKCTVKTRLRASPPRPSPPSEWKGGRRSLGNGCLQAPPELPPELVQARSAPPYTMVNCTLLSMIPALIA